MNKDKHTQDGLPIVNREALESTLVIMRRDLKKDLLMKDIRERLQSENPLLYQLLETLIKSYPESEYSDGFAGGFIICYETLRRQASTYKLESSS
ncbi:MAG: hypothetical protein AABY07_07385 [Nanoarchaeota archaeon]